MCEGFDTIQVAQDRGQWRALMNKVRHLPAP
jgi:hypothetical protein